MPGEEQSGCGNEDLRGESLMDHEDEVDAAFSRLLPDCRGYEMVSPVAKNGALLAPLFLALPSGVAADGERVLATSIQCFDGALGCTGDRATIGSTYEFARGEAGWAARSLAPAASTLEVSGTWARNPDSGEVLYSAAVPGHVQEELYAGGGGSLEAIGPMAETLNWQFTSIKALDITSDMSHILYESGEETLWPSFDATVGNNGEDKSVYEYAGRGQLRPLLVGVTGGAGSTSLVSVCGTVVGGEGPAFAEALSGDGSTAYFTAEKCGSGSGANTGVEVPAQQLYARIDGEGPQARTVHISQPECGSGSAPDETELSARADGGGVP